ncbi:MAG: trypsin-like peptidase domain-containing protein [Clostridia bacterium]|nr:trypsin-like peptidase domain-containing protein [Clostridia bacterium]
MQEFNEFQWHSENEETCDRMADMQATPKKKTRPWLIALCGVLAGGLLSFTVVPAVSRLIGGKEGSFQFAEIPVDTPKVTQVTYNSDTRTELSTVEIGKRVGPAVVGISTVVETSTYSFFGGTNTYESEGSGSGIIIAENGYVITNNHVISGAKKISVILNNGTEYEAKLIGADAKTDLAVLKVEASGLPTATLGNSDALEAGERVVAIGNPLGKELAGTLTQGIVSALNRTLTVDNVTYTLIQTDAAINPGNSGGALVNAFGEVIGINTVKVSSSEVEGLGFSIPINNAKPIVEDLINFGYVKNRPLIGLRVAYVNQQEADYYNIPAAGLFVSEVTAGSGAANAGIKKGDVILKCNGTEVKSSEELNAIRDNFRAGDSITLTINRDGQVIEVQVTLTEDKPSFTQ